jgi:AraC family transcriptional regulator of adaptative response/methylated-DNA-[protein]-cysteine methyltransferase
MNLDRTVCRRARLARDARFDGRFFIGVRITGIFCRPICPAISPREHNVDYFPTAAAAVDAGFRACLRCSPRDPLSPAGTASERARAYLAAHVDERVTLAALAEHAGMSAAHLQRTFTTAYGESPRRYQERLRVETMKRRLKEGARVSEAGYESGFGSSRGMNEGASRHLGMSPAAYRAGGRGLTIRYAIGASPLATVAVGLTGRGVCAVLLADDEDAALAALTAEFPRANARSRAAGPPVRPAPRLLSVRCSR